MKVQSPLDSLLVSGDAEWAGGGVAPPLEQSVPFSAGSAEDFREMASVPRHTRFYRRYGNPTEARLEAVLAAAEGGEAALAAASGMGAITTTILSLVSQGDHVVAQRHLYVGTLKLLQDLAPRFGIDVTFVDQTDPSAFESAITPRTRLMVLESPSNPLLKLTDLEAVAEIARRRHVLTVVDSTIGTPINQRPLDHGIDLVIHSVTKWLSGHCDVLAGVVIGSRALIDQIWTRHIVLGAVIAPFDAWLALRGLRTLSLRVRRQNATALAVARYLEGHPAIGHVYYPGLPTHPQHDVALRQMAGYGGMLSFELEGGYLAAAQLLDALHVPARSASLGGFRSLIVQPAAMWAQDQTEEQLADAGVAPGLLRMSVGIEEEADVLSDLAQALASIRAGAEQRETVVA